MDNNKYDIGRIRRYLNGELGEREMYELERQAQDDPMLADLLAGMELAGEDTVHQANLDEIRADIGKRAAPAVPVIRFAWGRWAVAASVLLLAGIGAFFVWRPVPESQMAAPPEIVVNGGVAEPQASDEADELASAAPVSTDSQQETGVTLESPVAQQRQAVRRDSRAVTRDRLASLSKPETAPALQGLDTLTGNRLAANASAAARSSAPSTPSVQRETVMLAARSAREAEEGKRLSMSIRSLQADSIRPMYRTVSGVIREKESGQPLSGAIVFSPGNNAMATQSGRDGKFILQVPAGGNNLTVASIGYESQTLDIRNQDSLVVALEESHQAVEEVVVVGYGRPSPSGYEYVQDTTAGKPKPISGWASFEQYLERETASSNGKGNVTLKFRVGDKGQPTDVQLEHTTNPALVKKAMEILQRGPRWERGREASGTVTVLIEFL